MAHSSSWWCADRGCPRVLGTVHPDGRLELDEPKRVAVDARGTITVTCPGCGRERAWKTNRAA